jgi:hypothetical protein
MTLDRLDNLSSLTCFGQSDLLQKVISVHVETIITMIGHYQCIHTVSLQCHEYKILAFNKYSDVPEFIKIFTNYCIV